MTPFIADGPMRGAQYAKEQAGRPMGPIGTYPNLNEAVDRAYTTEDYRRSMQRSRMYDIGVMVRQVEEMRQNAATSQLPGVEILLNEAVEQLAAAWTEIRAEVRNDEQQT